MDKNQCFDDERILYALFSVWIGMCVSLDKIWKQPDGIYKFSGTAVQKHESSELHFQSMKDWKLYQNKELQVGSLLRVKKDHNVAQIKLVLRAVFDAVLFLAENNLAFRGNSSKLGALDCGNFLSLIRLLSKYYAPLATHLQNLKAYKTSYLGWESQNAFIRLIGQDVRRVLIEKIQKRKYFAIMFDGTPDISKQDQLSQIVRTVECSENGCVIHENFIDFVATASKTGKALSVVILEKLKSDGLDISDCRGQGYDNGSNMAGAYKGVQAKILEVNPFAHFLPCAAHSLNLVGTNAAEKVKSARLMLGEVQNLYNFFSSSTSRWKLLKEMGGVTLKCQSNTRWSSRANAVSALWTQFENIVEILTKMTEDEEFSADVAAMADSRLRSLLTFRFILGISVWKSLLTHIDKCNEFLQLKNGEVNAASKRLASLCNWLSVFRESGFEEFYSESASLASRLEVELSSGFENVRRHRGKNRKYMDNSEREKLAGKSNMDVFKEEYFLALCDQMILEMSSRFNQIRTAAENFGFLRGEALEDSSGNFAQAVFDGELPY